ncbi:uncharacterized protein LOC119591458 [Penaeus monodon]|uniref:uncharacterized protein LOC119591458 n=1 Tax=Penaeus monodon TaxID=6687 RepID=UPI0018A719C2|nr:uncharacterized protein LOC119591458 [Penaeus monodon]
MEISGLFLMSLVLLSRDAFGSTEGESGRKTTREDAVEMPSSEGEREVLTPLGPRSWLPEQRKRSLFIESQGHIQRKQGSPVAETPGDGARVPVFPQAPSPALAPVPAAPTPPPRFYITRLAPVFRSSQFVGAPGGVNGLYSPPTTEPHTGIGGGAAVFSSPVADECINMCEFRNNFGGCDLNATCFFLMRG